MRSCKAASELTSINQDRALSIKERVSLFIHRMICAPCRAYKKQMHLLQRELGKVSEEDKPANVSLNDDARRRILEGINRNSGG